MRGIFAEVYLLGTAEVILLADSAISFACRHSTLHTNPTHICLNASRHRCKKSREPRRHRPGFPLIILSKPKSRHSILKAQANHCWGNGYMKASLLSAVQYIEPGETISPKEQSHRHRRTFMRGVLASLSEFIAVPNSMRIWSYCRPCDQSPMVTYLNVFVDIRESLLMSRLWCVFITRCSPDIKKGLNYRMWTIWSMTTGYLIPTLVCPR